MILMAAVPLGVQLYSVREALADDFEGVVRRVADMGYAGVELAGNYGAGGPAEAAAFIHSLGMKVTSAHLGLPDDDNSAEAIATARALGTPNWVIPWMGPELFATREGVLNVVTRLNRAAAAASAAGVTLLYHNHWFEFTSMSALDGLTPFDVMLPELDPAVQFEIDLYWVKTGGSNPAATLARLGARAPLLHLKDGPANLTEAMLALGEGVMDYAGILPSARAEWLIVELDRCDTDIFAALERSSVYLTSKGYAHGRA
jgi:sugar phosphate isomerase/epimerase